MLAWQEIVPIFKNAQLEPKAHSLNKKTRMCDPTEIDMLAVCFAAQAKAGEAVPRRLCRETFWPIAKKRKREPETRPTFHS